jgi:hypothetical protein
MKMKTSELTRAALDWAVDKCEGRGFVFGETDYTDGRTYQRGTAQATGPHYSSDWSQGGPIIEREGICVRQRMGETVWWSDYANSQPAPDGTGYRFLFKQGPTPLIAAMRCYVASKLGDEVDVPEELL